MKSCVQRTALWALLALVCAPVVAEPVGHPTFMSPHSDPIAKNGALVFVANTAADTVDVIDAGSFAVVTRINVGIDPVSVAVRPDGKEVWVSNHVSDSVSVIDSDPASVTWLNVIATVQDIDPGTKKTQFDEPVGIAFASNEKAYVALSTENKIAVVDVATRQVIKTLAIAAQDPRALAVRDGRLYVLPFESGNQTQISGCIGEPDGNLCTFDALEHVVNNNNVLSTGITVDIVKHPQMPDRDVFVFDTSNDQLITVGVNLGTMLNGLAVGSDHKVFVAQADARNDANGQAGSLNHGLAEMENRAFLNQITRVTCDEQCSGWSFFDLEPLPPQHPAPGMALATPFAIKLSGDEAILIATAANSDKLFSVDAQSGNVLGRVTVGAVPRGVALESDAQGAPERAWVLNVVDNTVSVVDVSSPGNLRVTTTIELDDPSHPIVKRGRKAFHDANASTTGTFSCESCHPDGHTDQLAWVLDTPLCSVAGCTQIPPRITMPVRGLRDTAPYHWDGIPGDPFGGINTASINVGVPARCNLDEPESCTLDLVDGGMASTMCEVGNCPVNDEGKQGALSQAERDDLAKFLLSVPYPPAPKRQFNNELSALAVDGFYVFHIAGVVRPNEPGPQPNVCGRCHRMPFLVSTNTPGTGMEAPTWRGAYDRWLVLPQGRTNLFDLLTNNQLTNGIPERSMWVRDGATFNNVWFMIVEQSTGHSGSFARTLTLNQSSIDSPLTSDLLDALEVSASEGAVLLQGEGVMINGNSTTPVALEFDARRNGGVYTSTIDSRQSFSRQELVSAASNGTFVGTFTGRLGEKVGYDHPQPGIWTGGPMHVQSGNVIWPIIAGDSPVLEISGRHLEEGAGVFVDGRRVPGYVECEGGEFPKCTGEAIRVHLASLPKPYGMHFLQLQNRRGLFTNEFIFHSMAGEDDNCPDTANPGQADSDGDGLGDRCDDNPFEFQINSGISGNWFDPSHNGEGWFVEILDDERALVYWFTHTPPGVDGEQAQAWIGGIGHINGSSIVVDATKTEITTGPPFGPDFDPERVIRRSWGKFVLSFRNCNSGVMYYRADDLDYGSGSLELTRLSTIGALGCDGENAEPDPPAGGFGVSAAISGAWYDPAHDGEGWLLEILDDGRALVAWFTYTPEGKQAWFYNVGEVNGNTIHFDLLTPAGADFGPGFDPQEMNLSPWGEATMTFDGCNSGSISYDSPLEGFGSGELDLVRLTALAGHTCP